MLLSHPRRCNCLLWALRLWWARGGYILMRWSRNGPWPHFLWSDDLRRVWGYQPIRPHAVPWDLLWFRGEVREECR